MLTCGLFGPITGLIIDRLGARTAYALGLSCLGSAYLLAGFSQKLWHYLPAVGLLGGIGAAALGMIVASALLSRWFTWRIGSIMSLPYAAIGAGMLVLPPLAQVLLSVYDWRIAHWLIGGGVLATLPLVMLLPLGRMTAGSNAWRLRHATAATGIFAAWSLSAALRTSAFWGLFAVYLFTALAAYSVIPHCVAYLVEHGFDALLAASAFGLAGMLSALGIVAMGWLSDRIGRRQAATISYISTLGGIAALIAISVWPSQLLLYAFVILFGLMQGGARADRRRHGHGAVPGRVGAIYGALSLAQGFGAALGSWLSGMLYELTGSYLTSFAVAACGALAGLASFWVVAAFREESIGAPAHSVQEGPNRQRTSAQRGPVARPRREYGW